MLRRKRLNLVYFWHIVFCIYLHIFLMVYKQKYDLYFKKSKKFKKHLFILYLYSFINSIAEQKIQRPKNNEFAKTKKKNTKC